MERQDRLGELEGIKIDEYGRKIASFLDAEKEDKIIQIAALGKLVVLGLMVECDEKEAFEFLEILKMKLRGAFSLKGGAVNDT